MAHAHCSTQPVPALGAPSSGSRFAAAMGTAARGLLRAVRGAMRLQPRTDPAWQRALHGLDARTLRDIGAPEWLVVNAELRAGAASRNHRHTRPWEAGGSHRLGGRDPRW